MFVYDPHDWDDEYHYTPAPPSPPTYALILCNKCGCTYLDKCPEHGLKHAEPFPKVRK